MNASAVTDSPGKREQLAHKGKPSPIPGQATNLLVFLLIVLGSGYLAWVKIDNQPPDQGLETLTWYATMGLLLAALVLIPNIFLSLRASLTEWMAPRECEAPGGPLPGQHQAHFRVPGSFEPRLEDAFSILEQRFPRLYAFQRFDPPHLYYCYLAKRGAIRLFAMSWIKLGLLLYSTLCALHLSGCPPLGRDDWFLSGIALAFCCFGVPGLLAWITVPYQKLLMCMLKQSDGIEITLSCSSASHPRKLDRLWEDLQNRFNDLFLP